MAEKALAPKEFLHALIKEIVSEPKAIKIQEKEEEGALRLILKVAPADMGTVIGKKGRLIFAIRTLLKTAGHHREKPIYLELAEEEKS